MSVPAVACSELSSEGTEGTEGSEGNEGFEGNEGCEGSECCEGNEGASTGVRMCVFEVK